MSTRGYTLVETLIVLALLGVLLGIALPPLGRYRDEAAVRAAREELAGALARVRITAASRGGASLLLDPGRGRIWTRADGSDAPAVDLAGRYGVRLDADAAGLVAFRYDGLGIPRISNRTVRIRRGGAEARLTVSSYGRVRRW